MFESNCYLIGSVYWSPHFVNIFVVHIFHMSHCHCKVRCKANVIIKTGEIPLVHPPLHNYLVTTNLHGIIIITVDKERRTVYSLDKLFPDH